jgi:Tol biopolymer transport system component
MVTALEDPVGGVAWSPEGDWLAISVAPGGGMNQQVYLIRPDGTGLGRLTDGGRENNWLGGWSKDGEALTFASNRASPESMDSSAAVSRSTTFWRKRESPCGIGRRDGTSRCT